MEREWVNDGQPDENGDITVHIKNKRSGARISTFKGKTEREVIEKIIDSQIEANRTIRRLRQPDQGRQSSVKIERKLLTEDDRMRLANDMTDPDKVVEAVSEIVTAKTGVAPEQIGSRFSKDDQKEELEYIQREAWAFRSMTPDYYPVEENQTALFEELKANGWPISRNNLSLAYQTLTERETLVPWPSEEDKENELTILEENKRRLHAVDQPNGTTKPNLPTRPRSVATGLRSSDATASAPLPPPKRPKYTRADIERMSREEYENKRRNEPGFRQFVDAMSA